MRRRPNLGRPEGRTAPQATNRPDPRSSPVTEHDASPRHRRPGGRGRRREKAPPGKVHRRRQIRPGAQWRIIPRWTGAAWEGGFGSGPAADVAEVMDRNTPAPRDPPACLGEIPMRRRDLHGRPGTWPGALPPERRAPLPAITAVTAKVCPGKENVRSPDGLSDKAPKTQARPLSREMLVPEGFPSFPGKDHIFKPVGSRL